jgi:hypothetical protein
MTTTIGFGVWGGMVFIGPFWGIIGHVKWQLAVACCWMTAFLGSMAHCKPGNKSFGIAVSFLANLPVGWIEQQTSALIQLLAPDDGSLGSAFGSMAGLRTAVGSIGTSIFLAILNGKFLSSAASHAGPHFSLHHTPFSFRKRGNMGLRQ